MMQSDCRARRAGVGVVMVCLAFASPSVAQSPGAAPNVAKACEVQDASVLRQCGRTCFPVCLDRKIAVRGSPIGQLCNELAVRKTREDQPSCQAAMTAAKLPPPGGETTEANAEEDYAAAKAHCDSTFPKPEGGVIKAPQGDEEPDACFVSFRNLECRLSALRGRLNQFEGALKVIRDKKYGDSLIGPQLCSVGREQLERDYSQADQARQPIENLQRVLGDELGCFDKYISWTQSLTCIRDDTRCLIRKEAEKKFLDDAGAPSHRASAELLATLKIAERTVEDITNVWRLYRRRCL